MNIKNVTFGILVGAVMMLGAGSDARAQSRRDIQRERQRIERENARSPRNDRRSYDSGNRSDRHSQQQIGNPTYAAGYQQGVIAGQYDRRGGKYNRSNVYRDTGSYPNAGDPTSTDYVYRQAYLQGYNDGFNGIRNY